MIRTDLAAMPLPVWIENAVVGPLVDPVDGAGIACVATTPGMKLVHLRADGPEGVLDRLEVHPSTERPVEEIDAAIYGGPLLPHFGHVVAASTACGRRDGWD